MINFYQEDDSHQSLKSPTYDQQTYNANYCQNENYNVSSTPTAHFQYIKNLNRNCMFLTTTAVSPFTVRNANIYTHQNENFYYGHQMPSTPISDSSYSSMLGTYQESKQKAQTSSSFEDSCYGSMNFPRNGDSLKLFTIDSILNDNTSIKNKDNDDCVQSSADGNK
jgi:hypothetical protein